MEYPDKIEIEFVVRGSNYILDYNYSNAPLTGGEVDRFSTKANLVRLDNKSLYEKEIGGEICESNKMNEKVNLLKLVYNKVK